MFAEWKPSDELKKKYFVETGKQLAGNEKIEFNPQSLTPEQRETLLKCRSTGQVIWQLPSMTVGVARTYHSASPEFKLKSVDLFDSIPTMNEWLARAEEAAQSQASFVTEMEAAMNAYREDMLSDFAQEVEDKIQRIRNMIGQRAYWQLSADNEIGQYEIDRLNQAGATYELSEYYAARDEFNHMLPTFQEEKKARDEAEEAAKAAKREEERQKQLEWAIEHGSERLVKGLQAGYNCNRLYKLERAEFEFPSYTLDLQNNGEWEERNNPTLAAMNERDAMLAAHPELSENDVSVVWLTAPALENALKRDEDDEEDDEEEEFAPREAVMIDSADFTEWLVKII